MRRLHITLQPTLAAIRRRLAMAYAGLPIGAPGQGLVEYGLILVMIMIVCVAILGLVGTTVSDLWYGRIIEAFPH